MQFFSKGLSRPADSEVPVLSPETVIREVKDGWALICDAGEGQIYGLNATGTFICKSMNGTRSVQEITEALAAECRKPADAVRGDVREFIEQLVAYGYVSWK